MVYLIYIVFIHRVCWCLHVDDFFASCVISWNFSDTPPGSLPGVPSLLHIPNGFTVKHKRFARILCQCDTNRAGHFTLDAHASRPFACVNICFHAMR